MSLRFFVRAAVVLAVIGAIVALWEWGPLGRLIEPEALDRSAALVRGHWYGYALAVVAFVAGGSLFAPLTALVAAAVLVFGAVGGFAVSMAGAIGSAVVTYLVGDLVGGGWLRSRTGTRFHELSVLVGERGLVAVIILRQLPVAPFPVVNMAAGASHIGFRDYLIGTSIGIVPGVLAITVLTGRFHTWIRDPSMLNAGIALAAALVAAGAVVAVAAAARQRLKRRPAEAPGRDAAET